MNLADLQEGRGQPPHLDTRTVEATDWDAVNWLEDRGLIPGDATGMERWESQVDSWRWWKRSNGRRR